MQQRIENVTFHQHAEMPEARLSMVLVARHGLANTRKALEALMAQTIANQIELIISIDDPALLEEIKGFVMNRQRFARSLFLLHRVESLVNARILSAAEASTGILAFGEDHCFVEPNWAEEVLAAFEHSKKIIGAAPVMANPNPAYAFSRAQFFINPWRA